MIFECLRISSTLEEDKIVIPVRGTVKLEKIVGTDKLFLYIFYKNTVSNEWRMLKNYVNICMPCVKKNESLN
jgi:hypothetical protein